LATLDTIPYFAAVVNNLFKENSNILFQGWFDGHTCGIMSGKKRLFSVLFV